MVEIILEAYVLRTVPLLSSVELVGRDVFTHRFDWQMMKEVYRVFTHEDYLLTHQSRSERVFRQYPNAHALDTRGLNVAVNTYRSALYIITTSASVPSCFYVMRPFILRNYAGVVAEWRADQDGPGRAIWENRSPRFDLAVRWNLALELVRTRSSEVSQNARVMVWPGDEIITYLQERSSVPLSDELSINFWGPQIDQAILYLSQAQDVSSLTS